MKIKINREALNRALLFLQTGMPSKPIIAIESWIKFSIEGERCDVEIKNGSVQMSAYVKVESEEDCSFCVPGYMITQMISKFPDGDVNIETVETEGLGIVSIKLKPKGHRKNYKIGCFPSEQFAKIDNSMDDPLVNFKISMKEFHEKVKIVSPNIPIGDVRPAFANLVLFSNHEDKMSLFTGNEFIMCRLDTDVEFLSSMIVDRSVAKYVSSINDAGDCEITITKNRFKLEFYGMTFYCSMVDGRVPNYQILLDKEPKDMVDIDREELLKSLSRIAMFNSEDNKINIQVKDQYMRLFASTANNEGEEIIDVLNPKNLEINFSMNHVYFRSALSAIKTERAMFGRADEFCAFVRPSSDSKDRQLWMFGPLAD